MTTPIRILLVDDHEVVRDADTAGRAVVAAGRLRPDLVLLDVVLPDESGIEACREIRAANPGVRVLMLTSFGDETAVLSSLLAGANGYLMKNVPRASLLDAIR